jgi:uncharacterized protein with HEPN domain
MSNERAVTIDRLRHMVTAAQAIDSYTRRGRDVFYEDSAIRDAILYQIVILGEAAKAVVQLDPTLARDVSEVEWSLLAKMRDRITHHYWTTDREVVWETATKDVPAIRAALASVLARIG